ncbi:MAG: hypothetical protein M3N21_03105 [Actinomycetota bacterium]|nr:hypothetical protein [Actinomycetota bacterium]
MDAALSRRMHRVLEPVHAMVYFAPEAPEEYAAVGLDVAANGAAAYFPARAACLGAVGPELVLATFFNFSPRAVAAGMAGAWDKASPEEVLAARYRAAERALRRLGGEVVDSVDLVEAASLAMESLAGCGPEGRPLYAATAAVPAPDGPAHLVLWHALTVLREYRGDGHIAVLTAHGISGVEANVLHAATGEMWDPELLRKTRAWSKEQWAEAAERLRARGLLDRDGGLTDDGRAHRQEVEDRTDALAIGPWQVLGEERCERLRELVRPLSKAVVAGGGLPFKTPAE